MIDEVKIRPFFFIGLILAVGLLLFFIFRPFLGALLLAGALAIIFHPVQHWLIKHLSRRPSVAALITLILIISLVIIPLILLSGQIFIEARNLYAGLATGAENSVIQNFIDQLTGRFNELAPFISFDLAKIQTEILNWLVSNFNTLFAGALKTALNLFIFLFALFYFIRDGEKLKQALIDLSPLEENQDNQIFLKLRRAVNSVIIGALLIAIIQGVATVLGFAIFGIGQPILWGSVGAIMALIPGIGAALLFIPAVIIKIAIGETAAALGLVIWGLLIVSPIDNILRPIFIERGINIHPFLILISVIGGLALFGLVGFLLGPIILSLFFALTSIYLDNTGLETTINKVTKR